MPFVPTALRRLEAATREFVNRAAEEEVDPDALRDVIDELEVELEGMYLTPEERAGSDAAVAQAIQRIEAMMKGAPN